VFDIDQKVKNGQQEEVDARIDENKTERVQILVDGDDAVFFGETTQDGSDQTLRKRFILSHVILVKFLTARIPQMIHLMRRDHGLE